MVTLDSKCLSTVHQSIQDFCISTQLQIHQDSRTRAIDFVPSLQTININSIDPFLNQQTDSRVLIDNSEIKIVLILWYPGKLTSIHGHPKGGCAFKVLHGHLKEMRYTADDDRPQLLSVSEFDTGAIAYIDDNMGYHAVENASEDYALSLHVYRK